MTYKNNFNVVNDNYVKLFVRPSAPFKARRISRRPGLRPELSARLAAWSEKTSL